MSRSQLWTDVPVEAELDADGFFRPSRDEVTAGLVAGYLGSSSFPPDEGCQTAREALESKMLQVLAERQCFVAFSGGRDSSVLLAVASAVARREGLPAPVAVTHAMKNHSAADEESWQVAVLEHLSAVGTPVEWVRLDSSDAFDLVGETAAQGLRELGVLWPALIHCATPLWRVAAGGVLVTGEGGDEVLAGQRVAALSLLRQGPWSKARFRGLLPIAARQLAPTEVRRRSVRRALLEASPQPDWVTAAARSRVVDQQVELLLEQPLDYRLAVVRHRRERGFALGLHNSARLAMRYDVTPHYPLFGADFVTALARQFGPFGPGSRTRALNALFDDLLPSAVLSRNTKARFHQPAFGPLARVFARDWDGSGLEGFDGISVERLKAHWALDQPWAGSMLLLQEAWLRTCAG